MELTDVLVCPKSGNRLLFDNDNSVVHVEGCDTVYPVIDGVIDFCCPEPVSARAIRSLPAIICGNVTLCIEVNSLYPSCLRALNIWGFNLSSVNFIYKSNYFPFPDCQSEQFRHYTQKVVIDETQIKTVDRASAALELTKASSERKKNRWI